MSHQNRDKIRNFSPAPRAIHLHCVKKAVDKWVKICETFWRGTRKARNKTRSKACENEKIARMQNKQRKKSSMINSDLILSHYEPRFALV